jgi:hypothetical protein
MKLAQDDEWKHLFKEYKNLFIRKSLENTQKAEILVQKLSDRQKQLRVKNGLSEYSDEQDKDYNYDKKKKSKKRQRMMCGIGEVKSHSNLKKNQRLIARDSNDKEFFPNSENYEVRTELSYDGDDLKSEKLEKISNKKKFAKTFFNGKNLGSENKNEMVQTGDPLLVKMRKIKENCFMMNNEGRNSDKTWTTVTGKKGRVNTNFDKLEEKKMLEAINNELLYNNGENLPIFTENWQKGAHRKSEKKSSKTNNNYTGNVDDSIDRMTDKPIKAQYVEKERSNRKEKILNTYDGLCDRLADN